MLNCKNIWLLFLPVLFVLKNNKVEAQVTGTIKVTFKNVVGNQPLVLDSGVYTDPFKESYSLSKFKYYISNVKAVASAKNMAAEKNSYHLIDQSKPVSTTFSFPAKPGRYNTLSFMIGVDSLHNVSGAQTGALDVINAMFWTWNSGYIMMKLEGTSPSSNQVNNKIEYHIGGYSGPNSAIRKLDLGAPTGQEIVVTADKTIEIIIEADIAKWWQVPNDIIIAEEPACMTPGILSKKVADNYSKIFSIKQILQH